MTTVKNKLEKSEKLKNFVTSKFFSEIFFRKIEIFLSILVKIEKFARGSPDPAGTNDT